MDESELKIKISFIAGLQEIVLNEVIKYPNFRVIKKETDSLYLDFVQNLTDIKNLRSVSRAYIVLQNSKYNPLYISNHKSILGKLIEIITNKNQKVFKTFKITCAGSDSAEVRSISEYIQKTYGLIEQEESDMKIHIIKSDDAWEIGIQITPRPLSVRDYKIKNMSGAMDSTIAYAVNSLCELENTNSYLNIFSGSATLLIEAGQCYPNIKQLLGFDNDKKHISLAMQNIKKSGLIEKIQIKYGNIFDKPDLGKFDVITSDLPFGMSISKNEDLENLYRSFVEYCQEKLNYEGKLVVYTSKHEILKKIISESKFKIVKTLELKFITAVNAYLKPKIFVCTLK
jgi:23S rRNA G2445 N2-methylase RlmL